METKYKRAFIYPPNEARQDYELDKDGVTSIIVPERGGWIKIYFNSFNDTTKGAGTVKMYAGMPYVVDGVIQAIGGAGGSSTGGRG